MFLDKIIFFWCTTESNQQHPQTPTTTKPQNQSLREVIVYGVMIGGAWW